MSSYSGSESRFGEFLAALRQARQAPDTTRIRAATCAFSIPMRSPNHLIRTLQEILGDLDPRLPRHPQVDHQIVFRDLLDRQLGGFGALEYLIDVARRAQAHVFQARSI